MTATSPPVAGTGVHRPGGRAGGLSRWLVPAGLGLLVAAVLLVSVGGDPDPFAPGSSAPDGYRGVRLLLEDAGAEVRTATVGEVADGLAARTAGDGAGIVAAPGAWLAPGDLEDLRSAAAAGATVVLAGLDQLVLEDPRVLARTPAQAVPRGECDIAPLEGLDAVDDISGLGIEVGRGGPGGDGEPVQRCFAGRGLAVVTRERVGAGEVIELSSPYVWANARLQPDKESGGRALDNGPMAVALLGDLDTVTFLDVRPPGAGGTPGTQSPLALLPLPVELALAQAVGAFVLYAWWRSRRLGRPVAEPVPVQVAGSELVEAVGGLLRRRGSPAGAAVVLRAEARRRLSPRVGVAPGADAAVLVDAVAARCGRDRRDVRRLLLDGPVDSTDALVALGRELDRLHAEVTDVQPTR